MKTKASFRYDKTDGLYENRGYERYMIRINNDFKINKWLEAHLDVNYKRSKSEEPHTNPMELNFRATAQFMQFVGVMDCGEMSKMEKIHWQ